MKSWTILLATLAATSALATTPPEENRFHYSGYIAQSYVRSIDNHIAGSSDDSIGSFERLEIGAYGSYKLNKSLDVRGAVKYDHEGHEFARTRILFALVEYHHCVDGYSHGVRVGRVRNSFAFQNDTRENPMARNMDFPPQAIYREPFKVLSTSGDGVQTFATLHTKNWGTIGSEITFARPIIYPQPDIVNGLMGFPAKGSFEGKSVSPLKTLHLEWASPEYRWKIHYDLSLLDLNYVPATRDFLPHDRLEVLIHTAGIKRYFDTWEVSAEILGVGRYGEIRDILHQTPSASRVLPLGYTVDAKFYSGNFSYMVGYNAWHNNYFDDEGKGQGAALKMPAHRFVSHDFNFGIKYTMDKWIFRSEFHNVRGSALLSIVDNPDMANIKPNYKFISLSATYKF